MVILTRPGLLLTSVKTPMDLARETLYSSNGIGRPREDSYLLSNNPVWNREGLRRLLGTLLICPGITGYIIKNTYLGNISQILHQYQVPRTKSYGPGVFPS